MDTIKYQLNARRQPYGQGADLSLRVEVLAFHQIFLITGSRRCVSILSQRLGLGSIHIKMKRSDSV